MNEEKKSSGLNIGGASIIMVFAVLCLTVFAILTLITANSELKMSVKTADGIKSYYSADTKAAEKVAGIKSSARNNNDLSVLETEFTKLGYTCKKEADSLVVSFSQIVDDNQSIEVSLTVSSDGTVSTDQYKEVNTKDFETDGTINVWDGN